MIVEIHAPRIAGAFRKHFELMRRRMIAPDAAVMGVRLAFGVPGLPTFECVNTPWQPYSQPSGPQMNALRVSCVSS